MKFSRVKLAQILSERLNEGKGSSRFATEIAAYLLAEGRTKELDSLLRDMQQDLADNGRLEVTAVTAFPMSAKALSDAKSTLKKAFPGAKQVIISERIDPDVIGGVKLELANQQLDVSVRSRLNKFIQLTTAEN
ncbi:F0F1 ATP synthase subunit delta [Candidatus Saccharibacteria bacterium]|nr:F0F1 ATP synthase subunit delta [Candidatus Saccharibacteria bacterium]